MKKSNLVYIVMSIFVAWCAGFYYLSTKFKISKYDSTVAKVNTFPMTLCIIIAILSVIYIIREVRRHDETRLTIPNFRYMVISVALTVAYVFVWQFAHTFYIVTFVYLFVLLTVFLDKEKITKKVLFWNGGISLSMCLFAYLVFEKLLGTKFVI